MVFLILKFGDCVEGGIKHICNCHIGYKGDLCTEPDCSNYKKCQNGNF